MENISTKILDRAAFRRAKYRHARRRMDLVRRDFPDLEPIHHRRVFRSERSAKLAAFGVDFQVSKQRANDDRGYYDGAYDNDNPRAVSVSNKEGHVRVICELTVWPWSLEYRHDCLTYRLPLKYGKKEKTKIWRRGLSWTGRKDHHWSLNNDKMRSIEVHASTDNKAIVEKFAELRKEDSLFDMQIQGETVELWERASRGWRWGKVADPRISSALLGR